MYFVTTLQLMCLTIIYLLNVVHLCGSNVVLHLLLDMWGNLARPEMLILTYIESYPSLQTS